MPRGTVPPVPTVSSGNREPVGQRFREPLGTAGNRSRPRCALCDSGEWHGWRHERYVYAAAPEYREQMVREHYPYECGPEGVELIRENGLLYPIAYLAQCDLEGGEGLVYLDEAGRRQLRDYERRRS